MEKRASEKYYIIMSLILGLIVLSLTLYFIFNEYFTRDELDWQECRQSIYLRSISPEIKKAGVTLVDLKNTFPLKCKTEVVTIDTAEPKVVYGKIADTVAAGWFLFGEGEYDIVPRDLIYDNSFCMVFARIHYTEKSGKDITRVWKEGKEISLEGFETYYRTTKMKNSDQTYNSYLPLLYFAEGNVKNFVFYKHPYSEDPLSLSPRYEEDILAVYRIDKYNSAKSYLGLGFDFKTFERVKISEEEEYKVIYLINPEDLGKIGCTEFITIPA